MLHDSNIRIRILKSRLLYIAVCVLAGLTAIPLLAILGEVLIKGWQQLGWSFLTEATPNAYKAMMAASAGEEIPGGIANGIVGTFLMLLLAAVVAIPVGIFCGICLSEYRKNWFAILVSYLTDLLQGTPSIIIGIITYIWVVVPMKGYSAFAGSVALFIMMLPLIIRSTEETMKVLPETLKEAGLALGGSYWRVMLQVMLPSALGSIFTGILLAISRVVGETAALIYTAGTVAGIPENLFKSGRTLAIHMYSLSREGMHMNEAYATAVILLVVVILINWVSDRIAKKLEKTS